MGFLWSWFVRKCCLLGRARPTECKGHNCAGRGTGYLVGLGRFFTKEVGKTGVPEESKWTVSNHCWGLIGEGGGSRSSSGVKVMGERGYLSSSLGK